MLSQPLQQWSWPKKKWSQPLYRLPQPLQMKSWPQTNWCQPLKKISKPLQSDLWRSDHSHFNSFSTATKVILATNNLMSAPEKMISVTAEVNLTIKYAITVTLKIISATTKVILAINKLVLVTAEYSDLISNLLPGLDVMLWLNALVMESCWISSNKASWGYYWSLAWSVDVVRNLFCC